MQFHEVVRHTRGKARDVILNLESRGGEVTAEAAIAELIEEFGEGCTAAMPIATFFARRQRPDESPTEFAIALEALLRRTEDAQRRQGRKASLCDDRDLLLTTQFMTGLQDEAVRQRLAPMQPRRMSFRDLRQELRVISEENHQAKELRRQRFQLYQQTTVWEKQLGPHRGKARQRSKATRTPVSPN